MVFRDLDKQALLENSVTTVAKIKILGTDETLTEDDYIVDWTYEDYRYVPDNGFIGQFVERILDGKLSNLPNNVSLENMEINLQLGIVNGIDNVTTYYDYGNFLVTSVKQEDTTGYYTFQSSDYTKKFNKLYEDNITYPCVALELANNVCEQAEVEIDYDGDAYIYISKDGILPKGSYNFKIDNKYYNFSIDNNLVGLDTLIYIENENKLIHKHVNNDYTITRTEYNVSSSSKRTGESLDYKKVKYNGFTNYDFVITGNNFNSDKTLREVMKDISKLAYSWVRVGCDNKVHIDFNVKTEDDVDEYNVLTTDHYYTSKNTNVLYGPVNKILIGMSQVEGENVYKTSSDYSKDKNCQINIYDNDLTYDEELRSIAINGCERLFGLTYLPLDIDTIGHPWLEGDDYLKLINLDGEIIYSYPFNRKLTYQGYIKSYISSEAASITESKYEYTSNINNRVKKTELIVDKQNQKIEGVVIEVDEQNEKIADMSLTVDELNSKIKQIADVTTSSKGTGVRTLENVLKNKIVYLNVHPTTRDIVGYYASTLLKASTKLRAGGKTITFESEKETIYYKLPTNLYHINDVYDEFVQDNVNNQCYIIHRIGIDDDGEKYELDNEVIEFIDDYIPIELLDGTYRVYMGSYPSAYIEVKAMVKNDYTSQFATNVELESTIKQTSDMFGVELSKKVDGKDFTGANILLKINDDESEAQIKADKIDLQGYVTVSDLSGSGTTVINGSNITTGNIDASKVTVSNLNADNITSGTISADKVSGGTLTGTTINNGNGTFKVASTGEMSCTNATANNLNISGGMVNLTDNSTSSINDPKIINTSKYGTNTSKLSSYSIDISSSDGYSSILGYSSLVVGAISNYGIDMAGGPYTGFIRVRDAAGSAVLKTDSVYVINPSNVGYGLTQSRGVVQYSDKKLKENIDYIECEMSKNIIKDLKPVEFNYVGSDIKHRGLIAQDVIETLNKNDIYDEIYSQDEFEYYRLTYEEFIADLIGCNKYLINKVEELEKRLSKLEGDDK